MAGAPPHPIPTIDFPAKEKFRRRGRCFLAADSKMDHKMKYIAHFIHDETNKESLYFFEEPDSNRTIVAIRAALAEAERDKNLKWKRIFDVMKGAKEPPELALVEGLRVFERLAEDMERTRERLNVYPWPKYPIEMWFTAKQTAPAAPVPAPVPTK